MNRFISLNRIEFVITDACGVCRKVMSTMKARQNGIH